MPLYRFLAYFVLIVLVPYRNKGSEKGDEMDLDHSTSFIAHIFSNYLGEINDDLNLHTDESGVIEQELPKQYKDSLQLIYYRIIDNETFTDNETWIESRNCWVKQHLQNLLT